MHFLIRHDSATSSTIFNLFLQDSSGFFRIRHDYATSSTIFNLFLQDSSGFVTILRLVQQFSTYFFRIFFFFLFFWLISEFRGYFFKNLQNSSGFFGQLQKVGAISSGFFKILWLVSEFRGYFFRILWLTWKVWGYLLRILGDYLRLLRNLAPIQNFGTIFPVSFWILLGFFESWRGRFSFSNQFSATKSSCIQRFFQDPFTILSGYFEIFGTLSKTVRFFRHFRGVPLQFPPKMIKFPANSPISTGKSWFQFKIETTIH